MFGAIGSPVSCLKKGASSRPIPLSAVALVQRQREGFFNLAKQSMREYFETHPFHDRESPEAIAVKVQVDIIIANLVAQWCHGNTDLARVEIPYCRKQREREQREALVREEYLTKQRLAHEKQLEQDRQQQLRCNGKAAMNSRNWSETNWRAGNAGAANGNVARQQASTRANGRWSGHAHHQSSTVVQSGMAWRASAHN